NLLPIRIACGLAWLPTNTLFSASSRMDVASAVEKPLTRIRNLRHEPRRGGHGHVRNMRQFRLLAVEPGHIDATLRHPLGQHLVAQLPIDAASMIDLPEHTGHELHTAGAQVSKLLVFLERE